MSDHLKWRRRSAVFPGERRRAEAPLVDLVDDAVMSLVERKARAVMTALGTVVGVTMLVAILGVTDTAKIQIDSRFNALEATEVDLTQTSSSSDAVGIKLDESSEQKAERVDGVVRAGVTWQADASKIHGVSILPGTGLRGDSQPTVLAASPAALTEAGVKYSSGFSYSQFESSRSLPVAVLGRLAARDLGVVSVEPSPTVFISGIQFQITGIVISAQRHPEILSDVIIPPRTALRFFGDPGSDGLASLWVQVRPGAARVVASQLPTVVDYLHPDRYTSIPPPDPQTLKQYISSDLRNLSFLLAGICLFLGLIGIANTTFVSVVERTGEIGLRRALGARRRDIGFQFLSESTIVGVIGGLAGSFFGVGILLAVTIARHWTAVISPELLVAGPLVGGIVGLLAGLYPALRATRIEPVAALRQA